MNIIFMQVSLICHRHILYLFRPHSLIIYFIQKESVILIYAPVNMSRITYIAYFRLLTFNCIILCHVFLIMNKRIKAVFGY